MTLITGATITNFLHIDDQMIFNEFEQQNILAGLFAAVKKSFAQAIFFGLGASMEQLSVAQYEDLRSSPNIPMSVLLTLKCNDKNNRITRILTPNSNEQTFLIDDAIYDEENYRTWLKERKFDLDKQMLFCNSTFVKELGNMLTTAPLDLIGIITGMSETLASAVNKYSAIDETKKKLENLNMFSGRLSNVTDKFEEVLPDPQESHAVRFEAYTVSNLKREEAERMARKAESVAVQTELNATRADLQNFKATMTRETTLRDQKVNDNRSMLEQIEQLRDRPQGEYCALVCGINKLRLERLSEQKRMRIKDAKNLLAELQQLRKEAELNITFMNGASGTKRKRNMIPMENLLKLYPVFHRNDELEMDKLELRLLKKKAELAKLNNEQEMFDFFETVFPQRKMKQMAQPTAVQEIVAECISAVKDIFNPKTYIRSNEKRQLEQLRSLIPSNKGFLLNGAFRATDEQHRFLIDNILDEYTYTIALFKDDRQSIFDDLKKNYGEWYKNVKFLVLSQLPSPGSRVGYVAPPDHWLNYCTFTVTNIDDEYRRKLTFYLGKQLEIICVDSRDEVKDEFRLGTKKYVASIDGQLIYARCSMGFDIIKYIRPGKAVKETHPRAAYQRLEDAIHKLSEFASTLMETENVPRQRPVFNTIALAAEVEQLEQEMAAKRRQKNTQMEALHHRINAPFEAPDVQNYADALAAEQRRLEDINGRIAAAQGNIAQFTTARTSFAEQIDGMTKYIELNEKIVVNTQDLVKHKNTIKECERNITKLNETLARLQLKDDELRRKIKCLKYKTIKTVQRAHEANIDWTAIDCDTVPPTLWQDIRNGIYIDPMDISIFFADMTDTFDPDVYYVNDKWYAVQGTCQAKSAELVADVNSETVELAHLQRRYNHLRNVILVEFMNCRTLLNELLNDIGREIHPDENIVYELTFDFDELIDHKSQIIFNIRIDGSVVGFRSLSILKRKRAMWLLFAALNEYSKAPFAFIDLDLLNEEIVTVIHPIVRRLSNKIQLFIDSSSTRFSDLAHVHYAVRPIDAGPQMMEVLRHDGRQSVFDDVSME